MFYNVGLGDKNGTARLYSDLKRSSLADSGGGFVAEGNLYLKDLDPKQFRSVDITLVDSGAFIQDLWRQFQGKRGVIKIDVEGLELGILKAISQHILPFCEKSQTPIVFFESWDIQKTFLEIQALFPGYSLYFLSQNTYAKNALSKVWGFIKQGKVVSLKKVTGTVTESGGNFILLPDDLAAVMS